MYVDLPGAAFVAAVSADIWHWRLRQLNPRIMELLRKKGSNDVQFTDSVSDRDICALSKSKQLAHPTTSTRTARGSIEFVCTGITDPFFPPLKGGCRFVTKYTEYTHEGGHPADNQL